MKHKSLDVPLSDIYRHVNNFFDHNPKLNSEVILRNNGRFCGKLYDEGFDR
jgi:hypothetical protein